MIPSSLGAGSWSGARCKAAGSEVGTRARSWAGIRCCGTASGDGCCMASGRIVVGPGTRCAVGSGGWPGRGIFIIVLGVTFFVSGLRNSKPHKGGFASTSELSRDSCLDECTYDTATTSTQPEDMRGSSLPPRQGEFRCVNGKGTCMHTFTCIHTCIFRRYITLCCHSPACCSP